MTEPSAPTARPPAGGSLRSPTPHAARFASQHRPPAKIEKKRKNISKKRKIVEETNLKPKIFEEKKFGEKIRENFFEIFFFSIF